MTAPLVLQYCHRLLQHSSCRRVPLSPITRQLRRARVTLQVDKAMQCVADLKRDDSK